MTSITIDQFEVPCRVMGTGPAVLCTELPLNPFACFNLLQKKLAANYRVVLIDLKCAIGHSDRKPPSHDLLDFLSDFSIKIMDKLSLDKVSLLGAYMYSPVAIDVALKAPDRVDNLVLLSVLGTATGPMTPIMRSILWFYRLPAIPSLFRFLPFRALVEWIDRYFIGPKRMQQIFLEPESVPVNLEDLYTQYQVPRDAAAALTLMWCIRNLRCDSIIPKLHEVRCPSLIIRGVQDEWIPLSDCEEFHSRLRGSTLVHISNTRHLPHLEDVDCTYEQIKMFLDKGVADNS